MLQNWCIGIHEMTAQPDSSEKWKASLENIYH